MVAKVIEKVVWFCFQELNHIEHRAHSILYVASLFPIVPMWFKIMLQQQPSFPYFCTP